MELNDALEQVRKLVALAEHPNTPPHEAALAATRADTIMLKFAIDQAMLRATKVGQKDSPETINIMVPADQDLSGYFGAMVRDLAQHCRCYTRLYDKFFWRGRNDLPYDTWSCKIYGYKSDLSYFEILYTQVQLHMLGVLRPKWDDSKSMDENCYFMHNAGYNWLEIAQLRGWTKSGSFKWDDERYGKERWVLKDKDGVVTEEKTNWQLGSEHKRAYFRICKAKGETPTRIPAGGTAGYRKDAAQGYINGLYRRLKATESKRGEEGVVALKVSLEELLEYFRKDNPVTKIEVVEEPECEQCKKNPSGYCKRHPRPAKPKTRQFNYDAYQRGVEHAATAPISPEMAGARKAVQ